MIVELTFNKERFRIIGVLSIILTLLFSFSFSHIANAEAQVQVPYNQELHYDTMEEYNEALNSGVFSEPNDDDPLITPTALVGATAVFVGGILVGFVVDGVIISSTGFSAGEWIAIGIAHSMCKAKLKTFYFDRNTGETACYGGAGGKW